MNVRILDEAAVRHLLPMGQCIDLMADALGAVSRGDVHNPLRWMVQPPGEESLLALMPSHRSGDRPLWGLKTISLFPSNQARGLDMHQGFVALFDGETGQTRAIMNAGGITAVRTAAVSGLATKLLARPDSKTLAIVGAGIQAKAHLEAMRAVRVFDRVLVSSRTPGRAERELDGVQEVPTVEEAVRDADVVVTATNSAEPVVRRDWLKEGAHLNVVGSSQPHAREVDSATVRDAAVFVDRRESTLNEAGDFLVPMQEGLVGAEHIRAEVGELVNGTAEGRRNDQELTLFKSLGLAIEDLVAAEHILARAEAENIGTVASL